MNESLYLRGFLSNIYLRPSCYDCHVKCGKSDSNITIGDFWGIDKIMPWINDDKGLNALLINDINGAKLLDNTDIDLWRTDYESVLKANPALEESAFLPLNRKQFYSTKESSYEKKIRKSLQPKLIYRIKSRIINFIHTIKAKR